MDELLALFANFSSFGAVNPVREFNQTNTGQNSLLIAELCQDLFEKLRNSFSAPFSGDDNTGIKNYSHEGRTKGSL